MAFSIVNSPELDNPLLGFRFGVFFLGGIGIAHPLDFRFQEVSGIEARIEMTTSDSMGEGENHRQFPGKTKYTNLTLTRGMPVLSTLRQEIQSSLTSPHRVARNVLVSILDENALPLNSWLFTDAYPVNWSISGLNASSGQVIIETMELTYSNFRPFSL